MRGHKIGDKVKVYQKPLTDEDYEGEATLIAKTPSQPIAPELEKWAVRFDGDSTNSIRTIKAVSLPNNIDDFIDAEFNKLVPFKPLTGPERAAIKLALQRFLEAEVNDLDTQIKAAKTCTEATVLRIIAEKIEGLSKKVTL